MLYRVGNCPADSEFNSRTGECEAPEPNECDPITQACLARAEKGSPDFCPRPYAGNPINFSVGNKFQKETDYQASGNSLLKLSRSYNSIDGLWRHNYSTHVLTTENSQTIALVMASGKEFFFTNNGSSVTAASANLGMLGKTNTGWLFVSTDNERFTFDTAGKLTHWSSTQGHSYQLAYSGSQITVTDNLGNSLTFTEDTDRQPLSLSAPGVQITYNYNTNKRLTSVNRTVGGQASQRQFHYEVAGKPDLLTGITDERGVRYATWAYDDQGRAISSEHAGGADRVSVSYNSDDTVSVTNELGKVAKYSFQTIRGVRRITAIEGEPSPNCPSSNSTFTYDDRGLLKTKTDNKGNLTTYDYNERGLEVSRTEASGTPQARTITTTWHPDWFLPVTITEPDRITQYTYDNQGRQTSQSVTQR
ncbi:YD repeat-containing protein [Pseudomonas sp. NFACC19-2]|nr:YD repeat-containing protein [Pseudomonas sp. NFACC19-2]